MINKYTVWFGEPAVVILFFCFSFGMLYSQFSAASLSLFQLLPYKRLHQITIFALLKNSTLLSNTPPFPPIGQPFIVLPTIDSTNNYAMARAREGLATHGSAYFAIRQTGGKGQRGKTWITHPGENIVLSVVLQPDGLFINNQFLLSASVALACYDFFKKYGGEENTRIKWPNDLYWQDRKAGGILIESILGGSEPDEKTSYWRWAIVGIGININQTIFSADISNPVSLKQITGKTEDVLTLAQELCTFIQKRYSGLISLPPTDIIQEYNRALYQLNQPVKLKKGNAIFETTIQGVSPMGILLTKDVIERAFNFGEVEWIRGK